MNYTRAMNESGNDCISLVAGGGTTGQDPTESETRGPHIRRIAVIAALFYMRVKIPQLTWVLFLSARLGLELLPVIYMDDMPLSCRAVAGCGRIYRKGMTPEGRAGCARLGRP